MIEKEILTRIADGLRQIGRANKVSGIYREDLKFFEWICKQNTDLISFLNSPSVDYPKKCQAMDELFKDLLVPEVMSFLKILIRDHMIDYLPQIREEYNRLADEDANIAEGQLFTPFVLPTSQVRKLERAFSNRIGRRVILTQIPDKKLIAGIRVILLDTEYEYSINTVLEGIKKNILSKEENQDGR